jgi:hypothetical protein
MEGMGVTYIRGVDKKIPKTKAAADFYNNNKEMLKSVEGTIEEKPVVAIYKTGGESSKGKIKESLSSRLKIGKFACKRMRQEAESFYTQETNYFFGEKKLPEVKKLDRADLLSKIKSDLSFLKKTKEGLVGERNIGVKNNVIFEEENKGIQSEASKNAKFNKKTVKAVDKYIHNAMDYLGDTNYLNEAQKSLKRRGEKWIKVKRKRQRKVSEKKSGANKIQDYSIVMCNYYSSLYLLTRSEEASVNKAKEKKRLFMEKKKKLEDEAKIREEQQKKENDKKEKERGKGKGKERGKEKEGKGGMDLEDTFSEMFEFSLGAKNGLKISFKGRKQTKTQAEKCAKMEDEKLNYGGLFLDRYKEELAKFESLPGVSKEKNEGKKKKGGSAECWDYEKYTYEDMEYLM